MYCIGLNDKSSEVQLSSEHGPDSLCLTGHYVNSGHVASTVQHEKQVRVCYVGEVTKLTKLLFLYERPY